MGNAQTYINYLTILLKYIAMIPHTQYLNVLGTIHSIIIHRLG